MKNMIQRRRLNDKGVTLTELLVSLSLIALLSSLLIPGITGFLWRDEERLFLQKFTLDMAEASEVAVAGRCRVDIKFDKGRGWYGVYPWRKPPIATGTVPPGFTLDHNFTDGGFHFNTQGHISRSGSIYLLEPNGKAKRIVLYMDGGVLLVQESGS